MTASCLAAAPHAGVLVLVIARGGDRQSDVDDPHFRLLISPAECMRRWLNTSDGAGGYTSMFVDVTISQPLPSNGNRHDMHRRRRRCRHRRVHCLPLCPAAASIGFLSMYSDCLCICAFIHRT